MKNLKKALALVLAIALCFSLVTIAGATNYDDFSDASSVSSDYAEAVDVVVGLKVINGTDGNKLDLTGTLTRAEAAKILTVLNLGTDLAKTVDSKTVSTGFSDTKNHWASGYIAYCAGQGYLVGSLGKFEPDEQLTGYAFGKMLLNVLGYGLSPKTVNGTDTTVNKYEGDQWEINVAIDAKDISLFEGVASDLSGALTRQDAMQMVFNALKNAVEGKDAKTNKAGYYALASEFEIEEGGSRDDNGYYGHVWFVDADDDDTVDDGEAVSTWVQTDVVVGTYPAGTTYKAIVADLGITSSTKAADATADYYINGVNKGGVYDLTSFVNDSDPTHKVPDFASLVVVKNTEAGKSVYSLIATAEYLVAAHKGAKVTTTTSENFGLYAWTFTGYSSATVYAAEDAYKDGNYYLVVPKGDNSAATKFLSITTPKSVVASKATSGDNSTIATSTYLYINGTKYTKSEKFVDSISSAAYNTSYDWLLNSAGYLAGVVTASSAEATEEHETGYVWLLKAEEQITTTAGGSSLIGGTTDYSWSIVAKANVAFTNGTTTTVDLHVVTTKDSGGEVTGATVGGVTLAAVTNQSEPVDITGSAANKFGGTGWYKYTKYDDGYTLEKVTTDSKALTAGTAVVDSKYATSATVANYYVYNSSTKTASVTSTTGYANFVTGTYDLVYTQTNNIISTIDTFATTSNDEVATYAYYAGTGEYDGVNNKTAYKFYVNGKTENYYDAGTYVSTLNPDVGDIVTYTLTDGKISAISGVTEVKGKTVTYIDADYSYIKVAASANAAEGTDVIYLAKDCVIYDTTKDGAVTTTLTARKVLSAGVDYNTGDVITYVVGTSGANNGKVVAIWITTAGGVYTEGSISA